MRIMQVRHLLSWVLAGILVLTEGIVVFDPGKLFFIQEAHSVGVSQ